MCVLYKHKPAILVVWWKWCVANSVKLFSQTIINQSLGSTVREKLYAWFQVIGLYGTTTISKVFGLLSIYIIIAIIKP